MEPLDFHRSSNASPSARRASPHALPPEATAPAEPQRDKVFISYSHVDAKWLEELQKRPKPLRPTSGISVWTTA